MKAEKSSLKRYLSPLTTGSLPRRGFWKTADLPGKIWMVRTGWNMNYVDELILKAEEMFNTKFLSYYDYFIGDICYAINKEE